jgi:hypothetical protein
MYESAELKLLLAKANPTMKTAILLGINCGFGATDIATLPQSAVDLDAGWIEFPRPKTAIERKIPVNGGGKVWRLAGEKCSARVVEVLVGAWLAARDEVLLRHFGPSDHYFDFVAALLERGARFRRLAS